MTLSDKEVTYLRAIAGMVNHHGSFGYLCQASDGWPFLAHHPAGVGPVLYTFGAP